MISKFPSCTTATKNSAAKQATYQEQPAIALSLNRGRTGLNVTAHGATALILAVAIGGGSAVVMVLTAMKVIH